MKLFKFMEKEKTVLTLLLLASFLFLFKISSIPIIDGDTAYYAVIARNILKAGNWLTLTYDFKNIIDKPPLCFWLMAISFKLFGVSDFAVNFWHALFGLGVVFITYSIGKELFGKRIGFFSGLILITSAQFFYQARTPLQDMPLTFFISLGLYFFLLFDRRRNYWFFYLTPISLALAVLTKGPIGLILPALIIFVYLLSSRKLFSYKLNDYLLHLPLALALFLIVAAPWFIAETIILGKDFLNIHIFSYFKRFFHPTVPMGIGKSLPTQKPQYNFYSYFLQLLLLLIPWSGFLYPSIYYLIREPLFQKTSKYFVLSWALTVIIFFSLSLDHKVGRYLLPSLPALAIVMGYFWERYLQEPEKIKNLFLISKLILLFLILPALIAATFWLILNFPAQQAGFQPIVFPFLILLSIGLIISCLIRNPKLAFSSFFLTGFISFTILLILMSIYYPNINPTKEFAEKALFSN